MDYYPENTRSRYWVELATPLRLEGPHEVALAGFHYTRSWYNVPTREDCNVRYLIEGEMPPDLSGKYRTLSLHLEPGHYTDVKQILDQLNHRKAPMTWTYSQVSRKVTLSWHERDWVVKLSNSVARKLGWPGAVTLSRPDKVPRHVTAPSEVTLDEIVLYVHGDLAADCNLVGHKRMPLLAAVSVQGNTGDVVNYEPWVLDWLPVRTTYVSTIEVFITDGAGRQVPFEQGTTLVKVHVRRRSPFTSVAWQHQQLTSWGITRVPCISVVLESGRCSGESLKWPCLCWSQQDVPQHVLDSVLDAARGRNLGESLKRRLGTEVVREIAPPLPKRRKQQGPIKRTNGVRPVTKQKKRTRARHADVFDWSQRHYHWWGSPLAVFPVHATGQ